jgi:hypothetical protein
MNYPKQLKQALHQPGSKPWDNTQNQAIFPERYNHSGKG